MGFFADWLAEADRVKVRMVNYHKMIEDSGYRILQQPEKLATFKRAVGEHDIMQRIADNMRQSRIIKVSADQLMLFAEIDRVKEQDYLQLRSPFPVIYVEPTAGDMTIKSYFQFGDVAVKGMMVHSIINADGWNVETLFGSEFTMAAEPVQHFFQVTWFIPLPNFQENTYTATLAVAKDGKLYSPNSAMLGGKRRVDTLDMVSKPTMAQGEVDSDTTDRMITWLIHIMNFLTSPAVILEDKGPSPELQKARAKRGKPPLPGWYEISYKKQRRAESTPTGEGAKHSFRYDVRGHFMHFTKGRLAGRVIWCPPHQRGLANELYKPKVYRVERDLDDQPEVYGG